MATSVLEELLKDPSLAVDETGEKRAPAAPDAAASATPSAASAGETEAERLKREAEETERKRKEAEEKARLEKQMEALRKVVGLPEMDRLRLYFKAWTINESIKKAVTPQPTEQVLDIATLEMLSPRGNETVVESAAFRVYTFQPRMKYIASVCVAP